MDERKRKQREAGLKAAETKGSDELRRAAKMAAWTRKHGKNDAANPYARANAVPTRDGAAVRLRSERAKAPAS
jgi:hypothetical protein